MHRSGDDTDGEDDPNLLDTNEDNNKRNQTNQDVEDNDSTEQQNNGTTLQENVKDKKGRTCIQTTHMRPWGIPQLDSQMSQRQTFIRISQL